MQENLYQRALAYREQHTVEVDSYEKFRKQVSQPGGFVRAHWDGTEETAQKVQAETKATIRCIPLSTTPEPGRCIYTGKPSQQRVIWAQGY